MNNLGYEDILRRMEIEQRQRRQVDNPFPPRQILELGREHPIVHNLPPEVGER